jgi:hypothetical protein
MQTLMLAGYVLREQQRAADRCGPADFAAVEQRAHVGARRTLASLAVSFAALGVVLLTLGVFH